MKSGTRGHPQSTWTSAYQPSPPRAMQVNWEVPHIIMCESQCENGPPRVQNQKAAQNVRSERKRCTHSEQADDFYPLSFFTHSMSVSLFLTGPLYSFSQKLHTGERHIVRKCGWWLSRSVNAALQTLVWILQLKNTVHVLLFAGVGVGVREGVTVPYPTFQRRNANRPNSSSPNRMDRTMIHHGTPPCWAARRSGNTVSLTWKTAGEHRC